MNTFRLLTYALNWVTVKYGWARFLTQFLM